MPPSTSLPSTILTPIQSLIVRRWRPQWLCQNRMRNAPGWLLATRSLSTSHQPSEKPYYVTTPIFYVNAQPHIGHMYSMLLADVLKRWAVLQGRKAILCTGTDEHGLKMQQAAAKANMEPQALCDINAETFKELASSIEISNDIFMRTTATKHKEAVEYAWQMLEQRGYIYESKHEGWYSVSDETFYSPGQVHLIVEPSTGRKIMASIETGKEVEWTSELNYHFRLSAFRDRLLDWYKQHPDWIVPMSTMEDVVNQVSENLEDLSISRPTSRLTWGIRVPTDDTQTMYVWLDALLNYASAVGYPFIPGKESESGWPADVHVIGKDIVRFHCIYWPAFLMALDLPLPGRVLSHAHWTLNRQKMAKSTGNVVNPFFALDRFGVDPMRWFLVLDGGIQNDADYDNHFIATKYKKGLQGGIGNLTGRIVKGKAWDVHRSAQNYSNKAGFVRTNDPTELRMFYGYLRTFKADVEQEMSRLMPNKALQRVMKLVYDSNAYLHNASPWTTVTKLKTIAADTTGQAMHELSKEGLTVDDLQEEIDRVIFLNAEAVRLVGIALQAFIPTSAKKILDMLGVDEERRTLEWCDVGKDDSYGKPMCSIDRDVKLFPSLIADD